MKFDFETSVSTHSRRIPLQPTNNTKKPSNPYRATSARRLPLPTTHLSPARSHLDLLIDHRFSKSSQRRRRYTLSTWSPLILVVCWTPIFLLLMSSLAPGVLAASESETITLSRALDSPPGELVELKTLLKSPPVADENSKPIHELTEVELSDDLELPDGIEDGSQNEDVSIFGEPEMDVFSGDMDLQADTMLVDEYSQISKREVHIKGGFLMFTCKKM
ncbi:unnamed protein product [Hydatigera taeniaeformis]|uniref:Transmembrane protein n=1 Tax=Hydatigena taeniaeformis TaxID=6205 RepID=A0A0R3WTU2_HYDTA|nr:unnamed protein product [Hydatigera taeniaeformis]